jgi:hypothetical protein
MIRKNFANFERGKHDRSAELLQEPEDCVKFAVVFARFPLQSVENQARK